MFIADPGITYHFLWCYHCKSIRWHSVKRREIRKIGNEWWVRLAVQCFGIAPIVANKLRKAETDCYEHSERWMPAVQWNVLMAVPDVFIAA